MQEPARVDVHSMFDALQRGLGTLDTVRRMYLRVREESMMWMWSRMRVDMREEVCAEQEHVKTCSV